MARARANRTQPFQAGDNQADDARLRDDHVIQLHQPGRRDHPGRPEQRATESRSRNLRERCYGSQRFVLHRLRNQASALPIDGQMRPASDVPTSETHCRQQVARQIATSGKLRKAQRALSEQPAHDDNVHRRRNMASLPF